MKLYKQLMDESGIAGDCMLITESGTLRDLQRKAEQLAALDGCIEYAWITGSDSPDFQYPYELPVNEIYSFVIRDW